MIPFVSFCIGREHASKLITDHLVWYDQHRQYKHVDGASMSVSCLSSKNHLYQAAQVNTQNPSMNFFFLLRENKLEKHFSILP